MSHKTTKAEMYFSRYRRISQFVTINSCYSSTCSFYNV